MIFIQRRDVQGSKSFSWIWRRWRMTEGWQSGGDYYAALFLQTRSVGPPSCHLKKMFCFPFLLFWIQQSFLCPLLLLCTFVQGKSKGIKCNQWTLIHNKASHPLALGAIVLLSNIIHPKWCYWQANVLLVLRGHTLKASLSSVASQFPDIPIQWLAWLKTPGSPLMCPSVGYLCYH